MHLFYTPNVTEPYFTLPEEESKHCVRTLRLQEGRQIKLTDGVGNFYIAQILVDNAKRCELKIISKEIIEKPNFQLHIAVAPTKNIGRFEFFLEKATEIGISKITPLFSRFSERKSIKFERLNKIIISASKQSLKAYKPFLCEAAKFNDFVKQDFAGQKFIAHCYSTPKKQLKSICETQKNTLILIGPEGDFSQQEVAFAKANGFIEISLSKARLRTETAAIVACHTVNLLNS